MCRHWLLMRCRGCRDLQGRLPPLPAGRRRVACEPPAREARCLWQGGAYPFSLREKVARSAGRGYGRSRAARTRQPSHRGTRHRAAARQTHAAAGGARGAASPSPSHPHPRSQLRAPAHASGVGAQGHAPAARKLCLSPRWEGASKHGLQGAQFDRCSIAATLPRRSPSFFSKARRLARSFGSSALTITPSKNASTCGRSRANRASAAT